MATRSTVPREVAYLSASAEIWEVRTAGPHSERVRVTLWLADAVGQPVEHPKGTAVLRHVRGNPTGSSFKVLGERVFTPENGISYGVALLTTLAEQMLSA